MLKQIDLLRAVKIALLMVAIPAISGCAAAGAIAGLAGNAMEMAGLKKDKNAPVEVKLAIVAGENLNVSNGQALAMVTKIYYLKNTEIFLRIPMSQLIDPAQEKAAFGESLVGSRELTLTPGQRFDSVEKVPKDAPYIAVAGLFYAPAPMRWKYVFKVEDAADTGIVLGAHGCAFTVTAGKPALPPAAASFDPARLAAVQCPVS